MPLWVKPSNAIETPAIMAAMRSHYEDTPLDFRADVGTQNLDASLIDWIWVVFDSVPSRIGGTTSLHP
jgi:hypothetical protein